MANEHVASEEDVMEDINTEEQVPMKSIKFTGYHAFYKSVAVSIKYIQYSAFNSSAFNIKRIKYVSSIQYKNHVSVYMKCLNLQLLLTI
jgi:hypothetical protein